jgi:hypothetical protein
MPKIFGKMIIKKYAIINTPIRVWLGEGDRLGDFYQENDSQKPFFDRGSQVPHNLC